MIPGGRIVRMVVLVGVVVAGLAPASSAGPVTSRTKIAAACAPVRVDGGQGAGTQSVRLKLIGHVSCATARRLARTYFHKIAAGQCGQFNNFCDLKIQGWYCSIFFATESQQTGGASAGCAQERGGAKVRFYTSRAQHQGADTVRGVTAPRSGLAAARLRACANDNALHVGIQVREVSCAKARRIVRAYYTATPERIFPNE
jgi:hypothetical protein